MLNISDTARAEERISQIIETCEEEFIHVCVTGEVDTIKEKLNELEKLNEIYKKVSEINSRTWKR